MSEPSGSDDAEVAAATAARDQEVASIREDGESFARWWKSARDAGVPFGVAAVGAIQWHYRYLHGADNDDDE
jgi:hypothetical protein